MSNSGLQFEESGVLALGIFCPLLSTHSSQAQFLEIWIKHESCTNLKEMTMRVKISEVCGASDVDGLRGDIATNCAAKAHAAHNGCEKVTLEDVSSPMHDHV